MEEEITDSILMHKLATGGFIYGYDYNHLHLPDTLPNGMILLKGTMNSEENLFTIYYKWNVIPELSTIKVKDYSQELVKQEIKMQQLRTSMAELKPFKPVYYTSKEIVSDNSWNHQAKDIIYVGLSLSYSLLKSLILTKLFIK